MKNIVLHPLYGVGIILLMNTTTQRVFVKFLEPQQKVMAGWFGSSEIAINLFTPGAA